MSSTGTKQRPRNVHAEGGPSLTKDDMLVTVGTGQGIVSMPEGKWNRLESVGSAEATHKLLESLLCEA